MRTLSGMGVTDSFIRRVFFLEGMLIVVVGTVAGLLVGLGLCALQQWTGMVSLQDSVVEAYPVKVMWTDLVLIFIAVMSIGTLAAWVPLRSLSRRYLTGA
jgi:ABC-type lipoprotein release transport system permease subunit